MVNSTQRLKKFFKNESIDRPPVTPILMMFAAKFINKTYRDYYLDYRVLVESWLRCHEQFQFDMVMVISDPYREAEGIGGRFEYPEGNVPTCIERAINNYADLKKLKIPDPRNCPRMLDRLRACELFQKEIGNEIPILGWIEGPMAQMSNLRGMNQIMMDLYDQPDFVADLLEFVIEVEKCFALGQIKSGAKWVGIGDSAASLISPKIYHNLIMPKQQELVEFIHQNGAQAKIHICGNITNHLKSLVQTGADIIDLDWMVPIEKAVDLLQPNQVACGNFDPVDILLNGKPDEIFEAAGECIQKGKGRMILSPGCEVPVHTPIENVAAFCSPTAFGKYISILRP
ncbi:uroporphyrinogen decarboxylase family protein [candidate division KSB1 bacterium]|nr:uroporphyrinogen decarboxylase family protein [candidate division KSB1 bacterium]